MALVPNEYHLVTFDPGGTIGWAHFALDVRAFSRPENKVLRWVKDWNCGEFTGARMTQLTECRELIYNARFEPMPYNTITEVVAEDFELTQLIGGDDLVSPVEVNAVLDWECHKMGLELYRQKRSMRTNVTPEKLKLYGFDSPMNRGGRWTKSGKGKDAFAAMQHSIVWLLGVKERSKRRPWKLSDGAHNTYWDCACERGRNGNRSRNSRSHDLTHPR
jgi:hypothetical protein